MNDETGGNFRLGDTALDESVYVIAEIGNNHEGDVGRAREMIALAADAGAHAVKFQTIEPAQLVSPRETARIAQLSRFRLSDDDTRGLAKFARERGVAFLSTPFHLGAVDLLDPLVPAFKIASGDNNFVPLLRKVARTGKPVLLSCGLADLQEVSKSQEAIREVWREQGNGAFIALLHCVSSYPTPPEQANLKAIPSLAAIADVAGYSDHTLGVDAAVASVALGARVIEKHFTLDKNFSDFRDHSLSADPDEMKALCQKVALVNRMLGDGEKKRMDCEDGLSLAARRSIAAARDLEEGVTIAEADITWLRPGGGLVPGRENDVLGRRLRRAVRSGDMLSPEDLA